MVNYFNSDQISREPLSIPPWSLSRNSNSEKLKDQMKEIILQRMSSFQISFLLWFGIWDSLLPALCLLLSASCSLLHALWFLLPAHFKLLPTPWQLVSASWSLLSPLLLSLLSHPCPSYLFITSCSMLPAHWSFRLAPSSLLFPICSKLPAPRSQAPAALLPTPYSLLHVPCSLLSTFYSLFHNCSHTPFLTVSIHLP